MNKEVWKVKGDGPPVIEVWEDFYGNLWFITEHRGEDIVYGYTRLYHMPQFAEWGESSMKEIKEATKGMVWKVVKKNWENIDTYEKGLLVRVQ